MKTLIDHLAQYAAYHRDPRNIHTHFVGVPMIMLAVVVLLSRPAWQMGDLPMSPALLAAQTTALWLASGIGLFVVGWVIQFVGHYYEGRKPAFVDDLVGLVVGPLFVVAEFGFLLGLRKEVEKAIEERSGPVRLRTGRAAA